MNDAPDDISIPSIPAGYSPERNLQMLPGVTVNAPDWEPDDSATEALRAEAESSLKFAKGVINGLFVSAVFLLIAAFVVWML